jgi:plasmid stability protein
VEATKRQLHVLAEKRRVRAAKHEQGGGEEDRDEMALLEEMEDFALDDMQKMLLHLDKEHPLLVAVASVRELGFNRYDSDEDD